MKQKRGIYLIAFFVACTLAGCSNSVRYENVSRFSWSDFVVTETIDSIPTGYAPFLSVPLRLLCVDSTLWVQNRNGAYFLERYRLPSLRPQGTGCVSFGHGPNEMLGLHRMQVQDSLFCLSDKMEQCCVEYQRRSLGDSVLTPVRKVHLEVPFADVRALPDSGFVATVLHPDHKRLSFFDAQGFCRFTEGEYPHFGATHTAIEQMESYMCEMVVDSRHKRIWLFYLLTDLIEIYDLEGHLIKRMHGPGGFFPAIKEVALADGMQKVSSVRGETRDAYFCPMLSGDKVYVLYSGRTFLPEQGLSAYLLNDLLVFDWDGCPYKHYKLTVPIFSFAIDAVRGELYGLSFDPEYHLVKYKL